MSIFSSIYKILKAASQVKNKSITKNNLTPVILIVLSAHPVGTDVSGFHLKLLNQINVQPSNQINVQ